MRRDLPASFRSRAFALALALTPTLAAPLHAQESREDRGTFPTISPDALGSRPPELPGPGLHVGMRPTILLTGYWPPTNEAVRRFSTSATQNPQGWIGSNWENRGYDVVSYFPDFTPPNCGGSCGAGTGDLTVDYQDTSADFWAIVGAIQPIAIMTFSRANQLQSWELEQNAYNFPAWVDDYAAPQQPTPSPPDASVPAGFLRTSTLPMQQIVDDIADANLGLNPYIDTTSHAGDFLSGFMAYHGMWYQSLHASPSDPTPCLAAGHIHVGQFVSWPRARRAAEISLRTLIHHLDGLIAGGCNDVDLYCPTTTNSAGPGTWLTTSGSTSIGANALRFLVSGMPANSAGTLVYSAGSASVPWGNGTRCIATPFQRLGPIQSADADGFLDRTVDFTTAPLGSGPFLVMPGSTWNFQYVHRDLAGGGAAFDMSNGARIVFCP
jgi:hypothetical protein